MTTIVGGKKLMKNRVHKIICIRDHSKRIPVPVPVPVLVEPQLQMSVLVSKMRGLTRTRLLSISGVTLLVILSISGSNVIDAFHHRFSPVAFSFVRQRHQQKRQRKHYISYDSKGSRDRECLRRQPFITTSATSLYAESKTNINSKSMDYNKPYPSTSSLSSSSSLSPPADDEDNVYDSWSTTASIDQEFQYPYDNGTINNSSINNDGDCDDNEEFDYNFNINFIENGEDEEDDDDDDFYKDFENFDYTPFLEKESPSSFDGVDANEMKKDTSNKGGTRHHKNAPNKLKQEKQQQQQQQLRPAVVDQPVHLLPLPGFNVVLTHCTADFDSLASAVGLAKLWSSQTNDVDGVGECNEDKDTGSSYDSSTNSFPTFVVLPRGAHPAVKRFLALHKHLFPIRSLKSLPKDLSKLNRLALVDAQRKDRIGPAEVLLKHANRVTVVDHHVDMESDIPNITDYVVDPVGSVSTLIVERLMKQQEEQQQQQQKRRMSHENSPSAASKSQPQLQLQSTTTRLTEAEATLLALGIHADTGSLCFDSTTPRDASALAWVMQQGASQVAIAEHAQSSLSPEQQKVLTQALVNANSTVVHGVTVTTVLLAADGFINGLAAVTQDAMDLSSSDVFLLGVVYESVRGGRRKKTKKPGEKIKSRLLSSKKQIKNQSSVANNPTSDYMDRLQRLRSSFDEKDKDGDGYINRKELSAALSDSGIIVMDDTIHDLMESIDKNKDGMICFEEFVNFSNDFQTTTSALKPNSNDSPSHSTLILIGRAKSGVNLKSVKLHKLLEQYGGGGHPKAASATVRLRDESEAPGIMTDLVRELIHTSFKEQSTVGEFMMSPVLSVRSDMTENQVEDLFTRYDVRALPVVNEADEVIGLVTYKEVAAAKQRMWNKEQKRLREEAAKKEKKKKNNHDDEENDNEEYSSLSDEDKTAKRKSIQKRRKAADERRKRGPVVKAWMKQHVQTVEASCTMAEVEAILLANDVGCIPVVLDGTRYLVGMVTRTDLLRQHRYYPSLHYNNKGMSDSIAARKPIIALRKKLKQFDLDE